CCHRVERSIEGGFQIVVRTGRPTIQAVAITSSALIDQDNVVLIGVTPFHYQGRQLRRRLARTASHIEDRPLVGVWLTRRDEDDLQRQFSSRSRPTVLEHIVNSAAQLLLYALNAAGRSKLANAAHNVPMVAKARIVTANFLMLRAQNNAQHTGLNVRWWIKQGAKKACRFSLTNRAILLCFESRDKRTGCMRGAGVLPGSGSSRSWSD